MKALKTIFSFLGVLLLTIPANLVAQNQMYWVHKDNVKPAMEAEYIKTAKEFAEACKTYNIQNADYSTWRHDDGSYLYTSPIKNYADLDINNLAPLAEKMGKEKFQDLFARFDKCYDSHTSFTTTYRSDLSYIPNGKLSDGNFRKYHFFYVTPSNSSAVAQKLTEIKELFSKKGSKEYYVIHHSGFGTPEEFYVAILAAKDEINYENISNENNTLMGEEWQKKWNELYVLMNRYETNNGYYMPDLSYTAKK